MLAGKEGDVARTQSNHFCNSTAINDSLWQFNQGTDSDLYGPYNVGLESQKLTRIVLVLSHGQASVERGFSFNHDTAVENMLEESLVAYRTVNDYLMNDCNEDPTQCIMSESLLTSLRSSCARAQVVLVTSKKNEQAKEERVKNENESAERWRGKEKCSRACA